MPIWTQNLLVIALAITCVAIIARQAMRALAGKKSSLVGCGSCKSCAPVDEKSKAEPKVQMVTTDMLLRNRR